MMSGPRKIDPRIALLKWYGDAGVDEGIGNRPVDRYAASQTPRSMERPLASNTALSEPKLMRAQTDIAQSARDIAGAALSLTALRDAFAAFDGCPLKETATNFVFADGNAQSRLMLVGEAPGMEEDRRGVPFVGPAGRLLDKMLAAIGMDRSACYVTNILPWRPPGNRNPTAAEISVCLPFVERPIELMDPEVLVFLGGTAAKTLLDTREGIMRLRGRWFNYKLNNIDKIVASRAVLHPAYLLRSPGHKGETWRDLMAIKERLKINA